MNPPPAIFYIPAKRHSTGIPGKNLAHVGGEPLVVHTLRAAAGARRPGDHIVVSSDSDEILNLARNWDATPIARPSELAGPGVPVRQVVAAELDQISALTTEDALLVLLLPTSPLRTAGTITAALTRYAMAPSIHSLVSVSSFDVSPDYAVSLSSTDGGRLGYVAGIDMFNRRSQRQQSRKLFFPNGAIYIVSLQAFRDHPFFFHETRTIGFEMDAISGLDVDTPEALVSADALMRQRGEGAASERVADA